ncbi:PREDICTED: ribosomal protein S2, mitochondrial-like [Prunus mume]|uniref:Ribosomal protein S2, mitochondrial-like n=1 Tax=Prunus mume TaxID=102107 RepID=A0ABM0PTW9_PRUMU|nr:PREDICTED: ribosomal protein S2, mitochondrial-like [Prunus mume]
MTLHSIVIQKLLSTNAHLGRRVAAHHFKQFTYGTRNGMAIIDSDRTLICLRTATEFIAALAQQKARFMFVNTNSLWDEIIEQMTKKIGCYSPSMNLLWRTGQMRLIDALRGRGMPSMYSWSCKRDNQAIKAQSLTSKL